MRKHEVIQAYAAGLIRRVLVQKLANDRKWYVLFDVAEYLSGNDIRDYGNGEKFCKLETARLKIREFASLDSVATALIECGIYEFTVKLEKPISGEK